MSDMDEVKKGGSVKFVRTSPPLFNYAKGYDANWPDPNEPLMPQ